MRQRMILALTFSLCAFFVALSPACALGAQAGPEERVRTSLDVLADVIDPASQIASEGCTAKKEAIVASVEANKVAPKKGQLELDQAIEQCNLQALAFGRMRRLHTEASQLVQAGNIAAAQDRIGSLREAWRGLGDSAPAPPGGPTAAASPGGWQDGGGS